MFYHVDVLRRRGGKFGTPWLAATSPRVLCKRDYSVFDVSQAADDLRSVVVGEQLDARDHRTRFSLYLSSQLMFGLVRILQKQIDITLKNAEMLVELLRKSLYTMPHTIENVLLGGRKGRHSNDQVLPTIDADPSLLNIEYGLYDILEPIPPEELPDVSVWNQFQDIEDLRGFMDRSQSISPLSLKLSESRLRFQAQLADITMKDVTIESGGRDYQIFPEDDLPIPTEEQLSAALSQTGSPEDPFGLESHDKSAKREVTPPLATDPEAVKEPPRPKKVRKDKRKTDDATIQAEPRVKKPSAATRLQLSELNVHEVLQHKRHKRERHLAIDDSIALDKKAMINHMSNTEPTIRTKTTAIPVFGEKSLEAIFREPARKKMTSVTLNDLWTDVGIIHALKELDEGVSESLESGVTSSHDGSLTQAPADVNLDQALPEETMQLSVEQQRETSKAAEELSLIHDVSRLPDDQKGNTSSSRSIRASSVRSAPSELSRQDTFHLDENVEILHPELNDIPGTDLNESRSLTEMHLHSIMMKLEACGGVATFEDICPLSTSADVASLMFIALLGGATKEYWEVEQADTFGEILIHLQLEVAM